MGGQTGLNIAMELEKAVLQRYNVACRCDEQAIKRAEDRAI